MVDDDLGDSMGRLLWSTGRLLWKFWSWQRQWTTSRSTYRRLADEQTKAAALDSGAGHRRSLSAKHYAETEG